MVEISVIILVEHFNWERALGFFDFLYCPVYFIPKIRFGISNNRAIIWIRCLRLKLFPIFVIGDFISFMFTDLNGSRGNSPPYKKTLK